MSDKYPSIAVIGGTGALGGGLVRRLARAGLPVIIGSRTAEKAARFAVEVGEECNVPGLCGFSNRAAAEAGGIVIVTVPFASQAAVLEEIAPAVEGKIVVDTTVPLVPPKVARVQLPFEGSAASIARAHLGDRVRLVTAFHNISAEKLGQSADVDCDVLVFGDDKEARSVIVDLLATLRVRGLHGGPLANAVAAEALTSVLIGINRRYKVSGGAGIRITGEFAAAAEA